VSTSIKCQSHQVIVAHSVTTTIVAGCSRLPNGEVNEIDSKENTSIFDEGFC